MNLRRLRAGELIVAAGCALMLISLFALTWYGAGPGTARARNGWNGATHLHWLLALEVLIGLALVVSQVALRAPALPACLSVISIVMSLAALMWLIFRVAIDPAPHQQAGAWLGLLAGCLLLAGSSLSLRQEGILEPDGPGDIPVVELETSAPA